MAFSEKIADELGIVVERVRAVEKLLEEGATIPFIARYRKESTGSLDEVAITSIRDRLGQLNLLEKRRQAIVSSLEERELLSEELSVRIGTASTLAELEDIYLPFRPKRRTRALMAREKGLEPLAMMILAQKTDPSIDPAGEAAAYIDEEKGVDSVDDALAGSRDIIAEIVSEDPDARRDLRDLFRTKGSISARVARGMEEGGAKYRDYFEWDELCDTAPSHRVLAMMRGEREKFLRLTIAPPQEDAERLLLQRFVTADVPASNEVAAAVSDSYRRLLSLSMASEMRSAMKARADEEAIKVFAENLRELLLSPPLGEKRVLAVDPGFRTGCKLVVLDEQAALLFHDTIYPHSGSGKAAEAAEKVKGLCGKYDIEVIAIGNGTASRETESFMRGVGLSSSMDILLVSESGASIYSASEVAREEFPDKDITVRGSISIGRRLMDPLAELVKIDPKSIGVGQYQHDVDQSHLKSSLDDVVMSCVNSVGVNLNTASRQLLSYVSGIGPALSSKIVDYRDSHGPFNGRSELLRVPKLGPKAFEQSAGFLRISGGANPLDASAVHPESYVVVDRISADNDCTVEELMKKQDLRDSVNLKDYVTESTGMPTLHDIMSELAKPGRDPRDRFEIFSFSKDVKKIKDVCVGMVLPGIVTNVTAFGAFVDIGVHQDGLVHISQLANRFVRDPAEIVKVNQQVEVRVLEVDLERNRIALSMKKEN
ncbi:MAG: RNA-binding transcriptional accessory protein [Candidatus Krumholzibacteria bacterium]|nr:RNA-binding transcriptional accessory protein [Candidatus Krumholzibacteria bacterium]